MRRHSPPLSALTPPARAGSRPRAAPAAALVLGVLLGALAGAGPAAAQTFFAESDALREGSAVELTLSELLEESRTDTGGAATFEDVDSALYRLEARLRAGVVALGAMGEARRFTEVTEGARQRDDTDQSAGYGALVLEGLLADEDALFLVLSAASRDDLFVYDDSVNTYRRELATDVNGQAGLVYRIGFLIGGVIRGEEEQRLRIRDTAPTAIDEAYAFDYDAWLAGLVFGDPEELGLVLVMQRKETPAVAGTRVDLAEGFEELKRASLGLGRVRLDYTQTRSRAAFTGESLHAVTERDVSLGIQLAERFLVAVSETRSEERREFLLLGVPITDTTERTEHLLRLAWRF